MDETLSTLDALPDIVAAGRVEILFTSMEVSEKEVKFSKPWVPTTVVLVVFLCGVLLQGEASSCA